MAITNQDRIAKALDLLKVGLGPYVDREIKSALKAGKRIAVVQTIAADQMARNKPMIEWDSSLLLRLMWDAWNDVFRDTLGPAERGLVGEIRGYRNKWAHQEPFSGDDTDRALDSISRLLTAVSATEADEVQRMKMELRRVIFDAQMRTERRKTSGTAIESEATGTLKPWREVVNPHKDVASGRYQQAEFAADLWQVHIGEGSDEYRSPTEFFRRTFLTQSLNQLLAGAMRRLTNGQGDPVVQLQTNFGGGKTHSMLALYHVFSGTPPAELLGVDALLLMPTSRRFRKRSIASSSSATRSPPAIPRPSRTVLLFAPSGASLPGSLVARRPSSAFGPTMSVPPARAMYCASS